jgi:hypothetical protein
MARAAGPREAAECSTECSESIGDGHHHHDGHEEEEEEVDAAQNTAGVSLGWLGEHPADAAGRLATQGMLRVNQVVGPGACARLRELLDHWLAEAQDVHAAAAVGIEQRWDMCVPLDGSVVEMLSQVRAVCLAVCRGAEPSRPLTREAGSSFA